MTDIVKQTNKRAAPQGDTVKAKRPKTYTAADFKESENAFRQKYPPNKSGEFNIVMMSGGDNCKMFVPGDLESRKSFFKDYLKLVHMGCRMTAKEQVSSIPDKRTKLMVDLDFEFDSEIPDMEDLIVTIADVVDNKYKDTYGDATKDAIIERRSFFKWHIIFCKIFDNQQAFVELAKPLAATCKAKYGSEWDWEKYFDPSIFNNNGLRLPYSYKNKHDDNVRRDESGKALDPEYYEILQDNGEDTLDMHSVTVDDMLQRSILPTDEELASCPLPAAAKSAFKKENKPATKKSKKIINEYQFLNQILKMDVDWEMSEGSDNSYRLIPDTQECLVNKEHTHSGKSHSCLYIRKRSVILNCFSCGKRTLPSQQAKAIVQLFKEHILGEGKDEVEKGYIRHRNKVLRIASENKYRRDEKGNIWRPIADLNYAFEYYKDPKDFLNEIFLDDDEFSENENSMDKLIKFILTYDRTEFPFMKMDRHYYGFKNGVLNIVTCEFTLKENVEDGITVRKYFDQDLDMDNTDTPLFDKIFKDQFEDDEKGGDHEGVYEFILMSLGRLFFHVGERDNWQYMLYLEGDAGTGRSTVMEIVQEFFTKIGTIGAAHEKKFGLASLYDQEIIIMDDLPAKFADVFPQTDFQTMVSGGILPVRNMQVTAFSEKWKVQSLMGGNWSIDYLDKGQVTRRVVNAKFEKEVEKVDPTLKRRIIQTELSKIILKCLRLYNVYIEKFSDKGVWDFAPTYFKNTQKEMRAERNPLFRFLTDEEKVLEEQNTETLLSEVKKAFELYRGKPVGKFDPQTFRQANPNWRVVQPKICRYCKEEHKKHCCDKYERN
ncbi:hypothetical protein HK097_002836, partial [Rhizophlyctis rosea]